MKHNLTELGKHLSKFLGSSTDGYGVFSKDDYLLGCNPAFAELFGGSPEDFNNQHFSYLVKFAFNTKKGIKIDSDDIEQWLKLAMSRRRSQALRMFEVDLLDGQWRLLSEQIIDSGEMLLHSKDITKQKQLEFDLSAKKAKLRALALTDELTQIANRRSFIESVNAEITRCQRHDANMAFLLIDIDFFKNVNDTFGHLAGDSVLISITTIIKNMLREYDIFGRLGGEEFGIFLAETPIEKALEIAERLREHVMKHEVNNDEQKINVTLSIGVSIASKHCTFKTLYKNADKALYEAKNNGRNKVVLIKSF